MRIAERSRVPYRSLRHHLSGRDMKRAVLVALADACGVSIEWLATGRGEMVATATEGMSQTQSQGLTNSPDTVTTPGDKPESLHSVIEFNRLVEANRLTMEAFDKRGIRPTPEQLTRIAVVVYDTLTHPALPDDPWKIAQILTSPFAEKERQKNLKRLAQDDE